ncbi:MAG: hypothetical protein NTV86_16630 [Planctomycetota bacterium]|nr:hypothetical protein [Planctomycetota bacterium]
MNLASRSRSYGYRSSSDPSPCRVLVSRRVAASPVAVACMSPATATRVAAESGPAEWSTDWLGYSRFDGVLVSDNDVAEMSSQTQNALRQYVECGGALLIAADRLPERFRPEDQPASGIAYLGFGVAVAVLRNDTRVEAQTWSHPWQRPLDADEVDSAFPVTEGTKIPVRGLSVLMILFAILIGPVNLVLLSRWKRRIWMLWIIPAVSLLTCAAVFGYSLFSEGWYAHVRSDVVTVLDESEARATTIGWTGYYAPLTPGDGLRFDATTELSPEGLVDEYYGYRRGDRGSGSARTVDLTSGQHLAAGWVSARVPAVFRVRDSQTRRERLTVRYEADGTPVVGNALGGAIKELYLADASGRIWRAEGLAEAAESRLSSTGLKARGGEGGLRKVYAESWLNQTAAIAREPAGFLRPGCYVAVMENCPFLTAGLAKTQSRRGQAVVYGIMKRDAHGG